jgi:valyl-tRNA synthetase
LHPFAPFITEELFQRLKVHIAVARNLDPTADPFTESTYKALRTKACTIAPFPQKVEWSPLKKEALSAFETIQEALYQIRNIRGEMKIPPGLAIDIVARPLEHQHILFALTKINRITFDETLDVKLSIVLPKELVAEEKKRLEKEKLRIEAEIAKISSQLANPSFVERAPQELVEKLKNHLSSALETEKAVVNKIKMLI